MAFPSQTIINGIKMSLKTNPVLCVEGVTDRKFFKSRENPNRSKVDKNVIVRACFGLENVSEIIPIIEEFLQSKNGENFNDCFGVIDWDYNWYHSRLPKLSSNIHHHDANNLESFVLFQEQIIKHFNESGASSENQFAVQCSEQIGYLRCINHKLKKKWRFKVSKSDSNIRSELIDLFSRNIEDQNLEAFRLGALKLYKMDIKEFNNHVLIIEQSTHYSQARIVNGKDLFSFIKRCHNDSTYENIEKRFTNEMFQTTSLSKHFTKWGISNS
tara:strand:- start:93 stop:905 length:813 start_codon:yes stop_codon:yes gene_type:complete